MSPGEAVKFQVQLQATSCANAINGNISETFEVYPAGVSDSLQITAEVECDCRCGDRVCI